MFFIYMLPIYLSIFAAFPDVSSVSFLELLSSIQPLMITLFGIAAYSIFILEFYEFISTRDIFKEESAYAKARQQFRERKAVGRIFDVIVSIAEYLFLFPLIVFFWAGVFFLIIVTVSNVAVGIILLTSVAIVGAIRICAYYSRKIAEDVAKLLPLVLLGNFVLNIRVISITGTYNTIKDALFSPAFQQLALHYLVFLIILEFFLRLLNFIWEHRKISKISEKETKEALETTDKFMVEEGKEDKEKE